jgi:predicted O-methyltransferase YrrM
VSQDAQERWTAVDNYFSDLFTTPDPALEAALQDAAAAGMPMIQVAPNQGKLLHVLALACGARTILEIGTLAGYSAIWLARALPADGKLITLESNSKHAEVARANLARARVSEKVEVRLGPAVETLAQLVADQSEPFDLVFIDADNVSAAAYFDWALKLTRRGSLIVTDNVVRDGAVVDATSADPMVQGARRFNAAVAAEPRVSATVLQTVGRKGYDGMAIAVVVAE